MNIVHIITRSDTLGGAHIHVRDISSRLLSVGHRVTVLVGQDGVFTEELRSRGIPFRSLDYLVRPIDLLSDMRALWGIRRELKDIRPDLVSTHSSKAGWLGRVVARTLNIPVIFTAHGWAFTEGVPPKQRKIYALAEKVIAPLTTKIIAVSEYDRNLALNYKLVSEDKILVVHNGMPDVALRFRAEPAHQPVRLVMVARYEDPKDHLTLIKALSGLRHLSWHLDLIGGGPKWLEIESMVTDFGLKDCIQIIGFSDDVQNILSETQVFLLISNWEGFPLSILEAMRAGLPVVASDVGGVREAVMNEETGFLVPRGDIETLRERLERIITDADLRVRMGIAGRLRYEAEFTFERMYDQTFKVYQDVIKR